MKYKVTLVPVTRHGPNPFDPVHIPMPTAATRTVEARVFEMDVASEDAIRRYFADAVSEAHPAVEGYMIHSIEEVKTGPKNRRGGRP